MKVGSESVSKAMESSKKKDKGARKSVFKSFKRRQSTPGSEGAGTSRQSNASSSEHQSLHSASGSSSIRPVRVDAKTSTPQMPSCTCADTVFYKINQQIGSETRHREFKTAAFIGANEYFRDLIGRYACGFLNSGGGTLYIGVNDAGFVKGVHLTEVERAEVEGIIRASLEKIDPKVSPKDYVVNFAGVEDSTTGGRVKDKYVLELCIHPLPHPHTPYRFQNKLFVRREASLQAFDGMNKIKAPFKKKVLND